MFWARLDFATPTTPGKNALEADEGAKQWARLVAKKPASPKKVTSLAQTTSQPRPKWRGSAQSQLFGLDSGDTAFVDVNFFVGELGGVNASYAADA